MRLLVRYRRWGSPIESDQVGIADLVEGFAAFWQYAVEEPISEIEDGEEVVLAEAVTAWCMVVQAEFVFRTQPLIDRDEGLVSFDVPHILVRVLVAHNGHETPGSDQAHRQNVDRPAFC